MCIDICFQTEVWHSWSKILKMDFLIRQNLSLNFLLGAFLHVVDYKSPSSQCWLWCMNTVMHEDLWQCNVDIYLSSMHKSILLILYRAVWYMQEFCIHSLTPRYCSKVYNEIPSYGFSENNRLEPKSGEIKIFFPRAVELSHN
jgi:hypothetical protein